MDAPDANLRFRVASERDEQLLLDFFQRLSPLSRSHWHPHPLDQRCARRLARTHGRVLLGLATEGEGNAEHVAAYHLAVVTPLLGDAYATTAVTPGHQAHRMGQATHLHVAPQLLRLGARRVWAKVDEDNEHVLRAARYGGWEAVGHSSWRGTVAAIYFLYRTCGLVGMVPYLVGLRWSVWRGRLRPSRLWLCRTLVS